MSFIETYTGRRFNPVEPDPAAIMVADIAHALSNKCRYTGHTSEFYSVAQHCVIVSNIVPEEFAMEGLLHDAAEAYLPDVAYPIKHNFPTLMSVEDNLHNVIAQKFGLIYPYPEAVTDVDRRITIDEAKAFMTSKGDWWGHDMDNGCYNGPGIKGFSPKKAKELFLNRFFELARPKVLV